MVRDRYSCSDNDSDCDSNGDSEIDNSKRLVTEYEVCAEKYQIKVLKIRIECKRLDHLIFFCTDQASEVDKSYMTIFYLYLLTHKLSKFPSLC